MQILTVILGCALAASLVAAWLLRVKYDASVGELRHSLDKVAAEKEALFKRLSALEESEERRKAVHDERVTKLNLVLYQREKEDLRARTEHDQAEARRAEELRRTWSRHENAVEEKIKVICQRRAIEYVDKEAFPHKGKPDNCVRICGELVVLDSKSPQGEDLENFPTYIKAQAVAAGKYVKGEDVCNDIFFVVPRSAAEGVDTKFYNQADYRVHVITEDAIEPILIARQKLEEYALADKLDPADREKICTFIGKVAHGMKRKVQVDQWFSKHFITLLSEAGELPSEIIDEVRAVERATRVSPPAERRKAIELKDLQDEQNRILQFAEGQQIDTQGSFEALNAVPLEK